VRTIEEAERAWRARHCVTPVVYFAARDGLIKIGTTRYLHHRLRTLKASLVAAVPGLPEDEREIQDRFQSLRVNGEWYRAEPELLAYIEDLPDPLGVRPPRARRVIQFSRSIRERGE
jgi:Meiotically up-regulated gene 113